MEFKVHYSFLHNNRVENQADEYRVYRQEVLNGVEGAFVIVDTLPATAVGENIEVTGIDIVTGCNGYSYNYKVSAYNQRGEVACINPTISGINFPCPTPSVSITPTVTSSTA